MAMFRFLLEARGHLAYFTVRDVREGLIDVVFSPDMTALVERALYEIGQSVLLERMDAAPSAALSPAGPLGGAERDVRTTGEDVVKML